MPRPALRESISSHCWCTPKGELEGEKSVRHGVRRMFRRVRLVTTQNPWLTATKLRCCQSATESQINTFTYKSEKKPNKKDIPWWACWWRQTAQAAPWLCWSSIHLSETKRAPAWFRTCRCGPDCGCKYRGRSAGSRWRRSAPAHACALRNIKQRNAKIKLVGKHANNKQHFKRYAHSSAH